MSPILEGCEKQRRAHPDRLAVWSRNEDLRLRCADLAALSEELAGQIGVGDGLPIAIATGNCVAFCALFLALCRLGRAFVGGDGAMTPAAKIDLCRRLGIGQLIHRHHPTPGSAALALGGGLWRENVALPGAATTPPPGTALVKLTSGSTGDPLGACFDEASLVAGIRQIGEGMEIESADRVLMAIPLSHSYGFDNGVLSLAVLGTPLVLEPSFYPAALLRALKESEATFLPLVPPLVRGIAQMAGDGAASDFRELALRKVICAGGTLLPESAEQFWSTTGRPVHNFFGSTETGGISFESSPGAPEARGTVGFALPGVRIELDAEGRVSIDSAANTCAHFGRDQVARRQKIATGDLATFTPEGRLRLFGRSADILNIGGKKVAAAEIENALRGLAGVRDAAVVGVEDPVRGDRSVAFLVADAWPVELQSLPPLLCPRELRRVDELPITERGKVDRSLLRSWASTRVQP